MEKTPLPESARAGTCESCKYLDRVLGADMTTRTPVCRRYPPQLASGLLITPNGPVIAAEPRFVIIMQPEDHWCGEYAPKSPH